MTEWTVDGVVLTLPSRDAPKARARLRAGLGLTAALALALGVCGLLRPPPAPVCSSADRCREHLPSEINPDPPELEAWVSTRVGEVLEEVRTMDRLPAHIDGVDRLSMDAPGPTEWAFLAAEHGDPERAFAAGPAPEGYADALQSALDQYRHASGEARVHFDDGTRFVAEIQAVRAAVDRLEARSRLDALAAEHRTVLDLGTASARDLVAAASALAEAEWRVRRTLEVTRLHDVTARLAVERTRADVSWLFAMALLSTALGFTVLGTGGLAVRARREARPVELVVGGQGIRLDGTWIERESIVWVGLRHGALRVVTRESDRASRPVDDDRALHVVLREWHRLSERGGVANPEDEARVRRLR
ncbi:MAG: hypothetical protein R3F61_08385 [Myxococcota bacterium]